MTPFEVLVLARRHGSTLRVCDGRRHSGASAPRPHSVVAVRRDHRDQLIEMLTLVPGLDRQFADDWQDMAQRFANIWARLDARAAPSARPPSSELGNHCPVCKQARWWQRAD